MSPIRDTGLCTSGRSNTNLLLLTIDNSFDVQGLCMPTTMERNDPLLPFAFTTSSRNDKVVLSTDPRERYIIDQHASSKYHTRITQRAEAMAEGVTRSRGPVLLNVPSIKRKVGESFTEKDDIKRRGCAEFFTGTDSESADYTGSSGIELNSTPSTAQSSFAAPETYKKALNVVPSSPPVHNPNWKYNISSHDVTVPDSPVSSPKASHLETSPLKRQLHVQSSEADFGIDSFNRFKFSALNHHPSADNDVENDPLAEIQRHTRARELILQSFEDMCASVSLAHLRLDEIPDEIKDLNNLVVFDNPTQSTRQLYLNNNNLRVLNPNLFQFTKLNVLSVRHNKLQFVPKLIEKLTDLHDLNISVNKLRHLPPLILNLPSLHTFRAGPNPFIEISEDAFEITDEDPRYASGLRWVSSMIYMREHSTVASLKSLCLDAIANYDVTYRETKYWKKVVPKLYHPLIALAISKGQFHDTCDECDLIVVESYAKIYEWWYILQNNNIPIKRRFCSGKCVQSYITRPHVVKPEF